MSPPPVVSRSFRLDPDALPKADIPRGPSLELTASDGTGLRLVSLTARLVCEAPLAFTELHLVFQNPEPRQIEGRFRVALPPGASVSRFAMRIGNGWQEGEVVERQAARRAYEDFLHRRQDPALLEHEAGNEFSARVFPIEANSQKEIIVSYSHELGEIDAPYRLPLLGLPEMERLQIRAILGQEGQSPAGSSLGGTTSNVRVVEVDKTHWRPDTDFVLDVKSPAEGHDGLRSGSLLVARVAPKLPSEPDEIRSLALLIDTSASRALGFDAQIALAFALVRGLAAGSGASTPVLVACFDQAVDVVFEGRAADFQGEHAQKILARGALGASDLAGTLAWLAARQGAFSMLGAAGPLRGPTPQTPPYERLLLVTDGVATAGDTAPEHLISAARGLESAGIRRLDVLSAGALADEGTLRRLVTMGLATDGVVVKSDAPLSEIAYRLTAATKSGIRVEIPGARWLWPNRLDGQQPGDTTLVYAELGDANSQGPVQVLLDGAPMSDQPLILADTERPLLERACIKARIERLNDLRAQPDTDPDVRAGLQKQIVELSVKHRVLSPYTALLVLETEADYERFQIDRRALADILTVGPSGLDVLRRSAANVPVSPAPVPKAPVRLSLKKAKAPAVDQLRSRPAPSMDALVAEPEMPETDDDSDDNVARSIGSADERLSLGEGGALSEAEEAPMDFADAGPELERAQAPREMDMEMPRPAASPAPAAPPPPPAARPLSRPAMAAPMPAMAAPAREMAAAAPPPGPPPPPRAPEPVPSPEGPRGFADTDQWGAQLASWTGPFRDIMTLILAGNLQKALAEALAWRARSPGDLLALTAVGEAAERSGHFELAARAYGSIVDLYPSRADLRRFAGERLSRLAAVPHAIAAKALDLAIDTYQKAVESRPDHPSGHRLLAMALLRAGRLSEAFEAIAAGQARSYPDKFPGIPRILLEDLGLVGCALLRAETLTKQQKDEILKRIVAAGGRPAMAPSVRFVLVWETDANDVDFHIHDAHGGHAFFREKQLPSGGELYADVTQGYGPECFTIPGDPSTRAYPYRLRAHYYRQGPMGFGMGTLTIIEHDGKGGFGFEERPYVVMQDGAYIDLGTVDGPLPITTFRPESGQRSEGA